MIITKRGQFQFGPRFCQKAAFDENFLLSGIAVNLQPETYYEKMMVSFQEYFSEKRQVHTTIGVWNGLFGLRK